MKAYIDRVKEVNPIINAVVATRYTEALEEAREVDRLLSLKPVPQELSVKDKPLLGVPLTVKEAFACKGKFYAHFGNENVSSLKRFLSYYE